MKLKLFWGSHKNEIWCILLWFKVIFFRHSYLAYKIHFENYKSWMFFSKIAVYFPKPWFVSCFCSKNHFDHVKINIKLCVENSWKLKFRSFGIGYWVLSARLEIDKFQKEISDANLAMIWPHFFVSWQVSIAKCTQRCMLLFSSI